MSKRTSNFSFLQRVQIWNSYVILEASKTNLPILDVYNMAQAHPYKPIDAMHYDDKVFCKAEDELLSYLTREFKIS